MALSDLELLELVEKAQQRQKGERGEPGIGISAIEQFDGTSFTLRLTDGNFKKIDLPTAKDGAVGPAGIQGQRGEPGPAGRAGRDGKPGLDGANGLPGTAGISVDTGIVNSNGHLLLGLTDGSVIDVGRVVGPAGATGERGATGLMGAAGRDGEAVLSGPRAPTQDDGKDGDHWIDLSSATFGFYKKSSGTWTKLGELKVSQLGQQRAAVGGSGSGGGGGVDLPPVIIGIDPPDKGNNNGPVRQGDLWFDSDQLALYVATKDASNSIVWVICIPGVTGVPGTQTASVPVVYPKAVDGEEWLNPLTQITYRYNEPKKQWINVNGGIVSVQDKAPLTPQTGSLWFDTEDDELTLYIYEGNAWVPAAPPVSLDGINATIDAALVVQEDLKARVEEGETEQRKIKLSLEELSVTKGSVARYQVKSVALGVASRNGDLYVNSAIAEEVTAVSFAPFDLNGQPTRPTNVGDIVEFVETMRSVGQVTRYRITSGTDAQALTVEYLSGNNNFAVDENEEVYIYPQNAESASKDYVDGQDALLQAQIDNKVNTDDIEGKYIEKDGDEFNVNKYLKFPGGGLSFYNSSDAKQGYLYSASDNLIQWTAYNGNGIKITARDGDPGGGRTFIDIKNVNSSGEEGADDGYRIKLYHVATPTESHHGANRKYVDEAVEGLATEQYVDEQIAAIPEPTGGGVPVGSIMIWMNSTAPAGWFKLQGGTFDVDANPQLHAYLQNTEGYTSGRLPNWGGHYPGEWGDHLTGGKLGKKAAQQTAKPSGGAPKTNSIPDGSTRTFNGAGGTSAYSAGASQISVNNGWDSVTRPPTVVVHYIIKGD